MRSRRTNRRHKTLIAIDLFSGCGGLTLGLKKAGFAVLGAVEIDTVATETYRINHPEVKLVQSDIRTVPVKKFRTELKLRKGELDLLAGCPPCQGFSTLRTQNGARKNRDRRNGLINTMLRFVDEFEPKAIMMENVPKLERHPLFAKFRRELRRPRLFHHFRHQRRRRLRSATATTAFDTDWRQNMPNRPREGKPQNTYSSLRHRRPASAWPRRG